MFLSWGHLKVRPFVVEFIFLKLKLAHQAECFSEIYALDIVSVLLLISTSLTCICYFRYPRVIAVSSGQGKLLRVSLELVDSCMETSSSDVPLAVADADVFVKIQNQVRQYWLIKRQCLLTNII